MREREPPGLPSSVSYPLEEVAAGQRHLPGTPSLVRAKEADVAAQFAPEGLERWLVLLPVRIISSSYMQQHNTANQPRRA